MNDVSAEQLPALNGQAESSAMLGLIARAASDPACDIEKMERLMAMHERMTERQASVAYAGALVALQCDLPAIAERGGITNRAGEIQSTYALWEDINEALKPLLRTHGFALTFRIATESGVNIQVTGVLTHKDGHSESTTFTLPADVSGGKNGVQAYGSSVSYGKRYTAAALLNITSYGEDDDGFKGGGKPIERPGLPTSGVWESMSSEQKEFLQKLAAMAADTLDTHGERAAADYLAAQQLDTEEKAALWTLLGSKERSAIKRGHKLAERGAPNESA